MDAIVGSGAQPMSPSNRIRLLGTAVQGSSSGPVVRMQVDSAGALCEPSAWVLALTLMVPEARMVRGSHRVPPVPPGITRVQVTVWP
jgi:hypothetical protein